MAGVRKWQRYDTDQWTTVSTTDKKSKQLPVDTHQSTTHYSTNIHTLAATDNRKAWQSTRLGIHTIDTSRQLQLCNIILLKENVTHGSQTNNKTTNRRALRECKPSTTVEQSHRWHLGGRGSRKLSPFVDWLPCQKWWLCINWYENALSSQGACTEVKQR